MLTIKAIGCLLTGGVLLSTAVSAQSSLMEYSRNNQYFSDGYVVIPDGSGGWYAGGFQEECMESMLLHFPDGDVANMVEIPAIPGTGVNDMAVLSDGSVIVAGSHGLSSDVASDFGGFVAKIDAQGDLLWTKKFLFNSPATNYPSELRRLLVSPAGNIYTYYMEVPSKKGVLMKFDANGDSLWWRSYGENISDIGLMKNDELVAIAGDTMYRLNSYGNMEWNCLFAKGARLTPLPDGTFIGIAGTDLFVTDTSGMEMGRVSLASDFSDLKAISSNGAKFYVAGTSVSGAARLAAYDILSMGEQWHRDMLPGVEISGISLAGNTLALTGHDLSAIDPNYNGGAGRFFLKTFDLDGNSFDPQADAGVTAVNISSIDIEPVPQGPADLKNITVYSTVTIKNFGSTTLDTVSVQFLSHEGMQCVTASRFVTFTGLNLAPGAEKTLNFTALYYAGKIVNPSLDLDFCLATVAPDNHLDADHSNDIYCKTATVTGIADQQAWQQNISIYPNPATDILNITSDGQAIKELSVYNMLGQQLLENRFSAEESISIDTQALPAGVYSLHIRTDKGECSRSFIKK